MPYKDPNNYVKLSGRIAEQLAKTEKNGAIWANQFDNVANRHGPYRRHRRRKSGPRPAARWTVLPARSAPAAPWRGVAIALKERNKDMRIAAADPLGAAIYSWIKTGKLESHGSSITEGIGQGRVTANLEGAPIDDAYQVSG